MLLAPLNNQVVFKKLFQNPQIIQAFVKDLIGVEMSPTNIEVEKQFDPPIGSVDFQIDVFVEDPQHRMVLEIQRVRYDYHYDRFLYYHLATIINMVKNHMHYKLDRTVYTIVWLTSRSNDPLYQHGIIKTTLHSVTDEDVVLDIFPHTIYFLNPNYMNERTPKGVADWMQLIQASISPAPQPEVASEREIIQQAASLISEDGLSPQERLRVIEENEYQAHLQHKYDEGALEGKLEVAYNMLESGFSPMDVAKITGLSQEELAVLV